jgi:hypothetical protein
MKKYAIYHHYSTTLKNQLHEAFEDYILSINRMLHHDLPDLKRQIKRKIEELNSQHPRCKKIELYFTDLSQNKKTIEISTNTGVKSEIIELILP